MTKTARAWSAMIAHKFGVCAILFALVVKAALFLGDPNARLTGGDGHYTWLFARSLALDHDIEFSNDYQLCGDPWNVGLNRGTGHPDNKFYSGPSLFWVPVLTLVHTLYPFSPDASPSDRAACGTSPVTAITLATSVLVGLATMVLCYLMALRFAPDGVAALATLVIGMGSPHLPFAAVFVSYSLVYCGFAVALSTWLVMRVLERPSLGRWALAGLGVGFAAFQRLPLIGYGLVGGVVALALFRRDRRLPQLASALGALATGALLGLLPTFAIYNYLYGSFTTIPQGRHYVHLTHPHPFLVLFGTHGGLFFQSPIVWLSVLGLPFVARFPRYRVFLLALIAASAVDLWVASSPLDYHSAWTYGARRLTTWMPLLVIFAAISLDRVAHWLKQREGRALQVLGVSAGVLLTLTFASWVFAYTRHRVPGADPLTQEQAYGTGLAEVFGLLDRLGIYPAILPGQLWYWARYRLPLTGYGQTIEPRWYRRDQVSLNIQADQIGIHSAEVNRQVRGFAQTSEGLALVGSQGRLVFAAEWPFATHFAISAKAKRNCSLRVGGGRWFGGANFFASVPLNGSGPRQELRVAIPKGEFDSGLNEFVFEPSGGECGVVIEAIRVVDETAYPPAL